MPATSFHTSDVDEAAAAISDAFHRQQLKPERNGRFQFNMSIGDLGSITAGILNCGCGLEANVGNLESTYSIAVALKGAFAIRYGSVDVIADPFTGVLTTPTGRLNLRGYDNGSEHLFLLKFDQDDLDTHLRNLLGRDRIGAIKLTPSLDLRTGRGAQWWRMSSTLALDLQSPSDGLVTNPLITAQLSSAIMTGLLLAADHPYRDDLEAWSRPVPPITIRKAINIIETRAHEPLTIPGIAAEIGCSVRALHAGYRKHLDMTPHEHLSRVRMDRAHTLLQHTHPDAATVADIAARCGFRHSGRFAAEYRKLYGVSPRITLRDM